MDKVIGAVIFAITIVVWVWPQDQEIYALHEGAYGFFTLAAIILAGRASA